MILVWVALGGALGACARYGTAVGVHHLIGGGWPIATLAMNVLGSVGIGALFVLLEREAVHELVRPLLLVGFLGGFTTFSTFSLEMLNMVERGAWGLAAGYALISVLSCFAGVLIGAAMMR